MKLNEIIKYAAIGAVLAIAGCDSRQSALEQKASAPVKKFDSQSEVYQSKKKSTPHELVNLVLECSDKYNMATWPMFILKENPKEGEDLASKMITVYPVNAGQANLEKQVGDERIKLIEAVYYDMNGHEKPTAGDRIEYSFKIIGPDGKVKFSKFMDVIKEDGKYLPIGEFDYGTNRLQKLCINQVPYRNAAVALLEQKLGE